LTFFSALASSCSMLIKPLMSRWTTMSAPTVSLEQPSGISEADWTI
jgi:hypothetical protein